MTTAFEELKTKDTTKLREKLYNHLGQAEYFRRRNVSKPITPKEQEFIRKVLQNRVTKLPSTKSKKKLCGNKFKSVRKVFLLVLQIVNLVGQLIYLFLQTFDVILQIIVVITHHCIDKNSIDERHSQNTSHNKQNRKVCFNQEYSCF